MVELNLIAGGKEQELIKKYLQGNVSEALAEKINNGVKIEKDNKTLINKKDLNGFMKFASMEARKLAEQGVNCACVEDKTVFGWSIHYFEEDTIEGTLYNEEGTEYKPMSKTTFTPKVEVKQKPKEEKTQQSFFDFADLSTNNKEHVEETENDEESCEEDEWTEEEKTQIIKQELTKQAEESPPKNIDKTTGEILPNSEVKQTFDKESVEILYTLLDGKLEVK